jgi:hypothetical protein
MLQAAFIRASLEIGSHTTLSRNARNRHSLANRARAVVETLHCHSSPPVGRRFLNRLAPWTLKGGGSLDRRRLITCY